MRFSSIRWRDFLWLIVGICTLGGRTEVTRADELLEAFRDPPREFSVMPFWFWNDPPTEDIRVRHVIKGNRHLYLLFNEESSIVVARLQVKVKGARQWWDPATGKVSEDTSNDPIEFAPHEMKLLCIAPAG